MNKKEKLDAKFKILKSLLHEKEKVKEILNDPEKNTDEIINQKISSRKS